MNNTDDLKIKARVLLDILKTTTCMSIMEDTLSEDGNADAQDIMDVANHLVELCRRLEIPIPESFLNLLD